MIASVSYETFHQKVDLYIIPSVAVEIFSDPVIYEYRLGNISIFVDKQFTSYKLVTTYLSTLITRHVEYVEIQFKMEKECIGSWEVEKI